MLNLNKFKIMTKIYKLKKNQKDKKKIKKLKRLYTNGKESMLKKLFG